MPASFSGEPKVEWSPDGVHMRLLEAFSFIDDAGETWTAPAGAITDGASIPGWLKGVIGGSYDGPYRKAAVIHDWYCDLRSREAEKVHRAFLDAMLCAGVDATKARVMYFAVRKYGPRWNAQAVLNTRLALGDAPAAGVFSSVAVAKKAATKARDERRTPPEFNRDEFETLAARIESGEMSVAEIEARTPLD